MKNQDSITVENCTITVNKLEMLLKILVDNGIEPDESETVAQAICYALLDEECNELISLASKKGELNYEPFN